MSINGKERIKLLTELCQLTGHADNILMAGKIWQKIRVFLNCQNEQPVDWLQTLDSTTRCLEMVLAGHPVRDADEVLVQARSAIAKGINAPKRESGGGVHGYEISGNTIYIGPMRADRMKVADITCTIDWDETYTDEAKQRRIRNAERICRGLDNE